MSNWWNVIKQNKLVNLPKFKVKPFNAAKPNEEDTQCKDKIMEIANFTKNFEFPDKIAQEFVRVKQEGTDYATMHYYGQKVKSKLQIHRFVKTGEIDNIPEEVFCKVLDMLNSNVKSERADVLDYTIDVVKLNGKSGYTQTIIIYHGGSIKMNLHLSIVWHWWFDSSKRTDMDDWQSMFIDEELIELSDKMGWPI